MNSNHRTRCRGSRRSVRYAGRDWPVLDRITLGRRCYLILKKTGTGLRTRYMAFDPDAGPDGDLRALLELPRSAATLQHVRVLKRLSVNNVNLPTILDYKATGKRIVLVLSWHWGPDLEEYLDRVRSGATPRPSATEALRLIRGLAHGLGQLHRRHAIVHGDIKSANLILASNPSRLVMIDFGSSWPIESGARRDMGDGLSRGYAAPEQQRGAAVPDLRSDQFSATVVLYELLTLSLPYEGLGGSAGQWGARMQQKLVEPSGLSPDRGRLPSAIWNDIDRIVGTALALDPDDRFPTCNAWLAEFDRIDAALRHRTRLSPLNEFLTGLVARFLRQRGQHD